MKNIPIKLRDHLGQDATSWCLLMKVTCKGVWDGLVLGFTSLDASVTYNDGSGPVTYRADNGFTPKRFQASADMDVDNTELQGWVSNIGVTEDQIRAGLFDYADVVVYRVNYLRLGDGHEIVMAGTCGETKFSENGWRTEFRSLTQQARQPISNPFSTTCRAQYGDAKCQKPFVWHAARVSGVGADPRRMFTSSGLTQPEGFFRVSVVQVLTGANAGEEMEAYVAGGVVLLALPLSSPLAITDQFRIRQDCDKTFEMCRDVHDNVLNNRSEHLARTDPSVLVPGAHIKKVDAQ
ncbi:DUF2163 domain-containing protein [Lysobacter soli]|uniref:DUF2163 domain-containing protein n=1 Tax=Lysobacter soli TaxID=453783 RepID=UPI0037CC86CF